MTAADEAGTRIVALDVVRGVAVMGILAMNIVGFGLPFQSYMNPVAFGAVGTADMASWVVSFIFIDGKMRGLFSFLFGASMLLVMERAEAGHDEPAEVHFRRMLWLLFFGLIHFYLIWFGDILIGYAAVGMVAYFFSHLSVRKLIGWGFAALVVQLLLFVAMTAGAVAARDAAIAPGASGAAITTWQAFERDFGVLRGNYLTQALETFRGSYGGIFADRISRQGLEPFTGLLLFGWETLAYMLFGMAGLKSGFFAGAWTKPRYRKVALLGFAIGIPAYAALAWIYASSGFSVTMTFAVVMAATIPFRPLMVIATAALIIAITSREGFLVERVAAAGRAAFTNYLGTSILMTSLFYGYGFGLFGHLGRAELWLVVIPMWALMLLWSKPWLDRYRYGPFEWLWRSLARGEMQPMRRPLAAA